MVISSQSKIGKILRAYHPIKQILEKELLYSFDPKWIISEPVFLQSFGGGKDQSLHYDFQPEEIKSTGVYHKLGGIILALDDNAKVKVFESENKVEKLITLKKGEVFLFLGDLQHSGVGYKKDNLRFHCKLTFKCLDPLMQNQVSSQTHSKITCKTCKKSFNTRGALFNHKKSLSNPKCMDITREKAITRKENFKKMKNRKVSCQHCEKIVAKNNFKRHHNNLHYGMEIQCQELTETEKIEFNK